MALGLALLAASMGLLFWNQRDADRAEAASMELLPAVSEAIAAQPATEPTLSPLPDHPTKPAMKAVEEVCSGQFDLTLVTCTYGGNTRLVVYCDRP